MYQVVACSSTSCCNRVVFHGSVHNLGWLVVQKKEKHKRNMNDSVSVSSPPSLPFFFFFLPLTSLDGWSKVFFFFFSLLLQLFAPLLSPEKLDKISDPVWNWGEGAMGRHTHTNRRTDKQQAVVTRAWNYCCVRCSWKNAATISLSPLIKQDPSPPWSCRTSALVSDRRHKWINILVLLFIPKNEA